MIDLETELALIGTIIRYPAAIRHSECLSASNFYSTEVGEIFTEILLQVAETSTISPFNLPHKTVVARAMSASDDRLHDIENKAKYLLELSQRRQLKGACETALSMLANEKSTGEVMPILTGVEENLSKDSSNMFHDAATVQQKVAFQKRSGVVSYPSGLIKLDEALDGGFHEGKAYGFAGRKKIGKTALVATLSHNLNENGIRHLVICGEMGELEIHERVIARQLQVRPRELRTMSDKIAALQTRDNAIYHDAPGISFDALKRAVGMAKVRYDIKGYILDYWQLVSGKPAKMTTAEHLGEVAQWVADSCRKLKLFAVVMAQLNQDGNTRGSEGIRLAFDQMYQLHRPDVTKPEAWLEMMETRYTEWMNVGSENNAGLMMNECGPYFEETGNGPRYSCA